MSDLISRQDAIDALQEYWDTIKDKHITLDGEMAVYADCKRIIKMLPSAEPERKTGKWLIKRFGADAQCSECGTYFSDAYDTDNSDAFCRHCGAKMDGLKEGEQ